MTRFRYTARGLDGRRTSGEVTALNQEEATQRLQEAGVYVISVAPLLIQRRLFLPGRIFIPYQERIFLLESWAMFLEAGLSMQSAIMRLRMKTRLPGLARALDQVQLAIDRGATLAEALKQARLFPASWIAILSVGEVRGDFVGPLKMLHHYAVESNRFKRELISMMIMPSFLLVLVAVWLWLFTLRVVPSMVSLLGQVGTRLPHLELITSLTQAVLWGIRWSPLALVLLFFISRWASRADHEMGVLQAWTPTWIPIVGHFISQTQLIVIASGLSLQVEAGIPLVTALETLAHGMSNRGIRRDLTEAVWKLREGIPVPEVLVHLRVLPAMSRALLVAGDATGKLPEMLDYLAKEAQATLLEYVKRFVVLIRSFVILATGILVGLVMITFFGLLFSSIGHFSKATGSPQAVLSDWSK